MNSQMLLAEQVAEDGKIHGEANQPSVDIRGDVNMYETEEGGILVLDEDNVGAEIEVTGEGPQVEIVVGVDTANLDRITPAEPQEEPTIGRAGQNRVERFD